MAVCPSCGKPAEGDKRFCKHCGADLPAPVAAATSPAAASPATATEIAGAPAAANGCPTCGAENKPESRFCKNCASPLGVSQAEPAAKFQICPQCGTANRGGVEFCKSCGESMAARAAAPAAAASPHPGAVAGAAQVAPAAPRAAAYQPRPMPEAESRKPVLIAGALLLLVALGGAGWYFWTKPAETTAQGIESQPAQPAPALPAQAAAAVADPALIANNESSAVGALRTINTAGVTYSSTYPDIGFPRSLVHMEPPAQGSSSSRTAGLISAELASGTKSGYIFTYQAGPPDSSLGHVVITYKAYAVPVTPGFSGKRSFCTDQTGVIRHSNNLADPCDLRWAIPLNGASPPPWSPGALAEAGSPAQPAQSTPDTADTVRNLLAQAEARFQQSDYRGALAACDEALRLDPQNSQAKALKNKVAETMKILGAE